MSKTIAVEQLPRKVERLLQEAWEGEDRVLLERNGEPVAAVVPMEDYWRLYPKADRGKRKVGGRRQDSASPLEPASSLAYELPSDLLAEYHRLLDQKLGEGLTPDEEAELERVGRELDEADMATPLGQYIDAKARAEHKRRMSLLDELIDKLKRIQASE
ncbi:MAG: hypothetical protein HY318_09175 [Armatimonadetes bacterium]|nr:hypothetical protein [Armatimonadota bacterium]